MDYNCNLHLNPSLPGVFDNSKYNMMNTGKYSGSICNSVYQHMVNDVYFPDLPIATEIDDSIIENILDNIEYLIDTEVLIESVSSEQSDNIHFVPANLDIINNNLHSVFPFNNNKTVNDYMNNNGCSIASYYMNNNNQYHNNISPQSYSPPTDDTMTPCSNSANSANSANSTNSSVSHGDNIKIDDIINKKLSIRQLVDFDLIKRLISDQNGSRYLQNILKKSRPTSVLLMINYCISKLDLVELSEDVYGNYIVQIFFIKTSQIEHKLLLDTFVNDNFLRLSKSMYGCRVIQKCLSCVTNANYLSQMVLSFEKQIKNGNKLSECLVCPYTNHVIQAILDLKLECKYINFIKLELEKNLSFYCEHIIGCRIVQCFIKNYGDKLNVLSLISQGKHLYLSKLKYGNYVIQCIIEPNAWYSKLRKIQSFKNKLIEDVFHNQNILYLSKNKFGSNVVEKCIQVSNKNQKLYLFDMLTNNDYIIPSMVNHCYGKYVIKSLLNYFDRTNQLSFIKAIKFYCNNNIIKKDLLKVINEIETNGNNNYQI